MRYERARLMCATLVTLAAAGSAWGAPGATVSFATVAAGRASSIQQATRIAIRDEAAWAALWSRHLGPRLGPVPAVDFSREMIVAIFAGTTPAVRAVTITRIVQEPDALVVWYVLREGSPLPPGEATGAAAPFHIVRLARSPLAVRFAQVKTPPVIPQP
jgi:hypothetical protein